MSKKPKSAVKDGYGIMNAYGDMWSPTLFETEAEAHQYAAAFWKGIKLDKPFRYSVVKARQRTYPIQANNRIAGEVKP